MGIQKIMVVGAGLMGSGIAQVCAQAKRDVLLQDVHVSGNRRRALVPAPVAAQKGQSRSPGSENRPGLV